MNKDLVRNITQTPDGFYWYGNSSGLYRFNGQLSTHLVVKDQASSITHDQFISSNIFPDKNGLYWFSTYQALHSLNSLTGKFSTFRVGLNNQEVQTGYHVFHFDEKREEILLKADTTLFAFDVRTYSYRMLLEHTDANEIQALPEGDLLTFFGAPWWNADGIEYFEYKSGAIINFRRIELPVMVKHATPYTKDSIFIATEFGLQLLTSHATLKDWSLVTVIPGIARDVTLSKNRATLFTSISGQGIHALDPETGQITGSWTMSGGLKSDDARALVPDREGNLFVNHKVEGVDLIIAKNESITFTPSWGNAAICDISTLSSGALVSIDEAGNLFTLAAMNNRDAHNWQRVSWLSSSLPILKARIDRAADGSIHIHGTTGFASLASTSDSVYYSKLEHCIYRGILAFDNGERLVVTNSGIVSFNRSNEATPVNGLHLGPNNYFSNIVKLTDSRFLASYRETELWDVHRNGTAWEVQAKYPLPGEMQDAVLLLDDLYVGTSAGLLKLDADSLITAFNPLYTIGNLWVNALHLDPHNRLWLGTEQGLFCYNPPSGEYLYFSKSDGLDDDHFIRANVVASGSVVTMATKTGLVTIHTNLRNTNTSNNKIYLSGIWINGIRKTDYLLGDPQPLKLDFQHNAVSFLPGMIELSSSSLSGFRYRLDGLETEFTHSKPGEVIRYPSLPPGKYSLQFVGIDRNGRSTKPFVLPVTITPPFYQTWWFWLLCVSSLLALGFYLNRLAVKRETSRQQLIQKEQARKAAETLARHQAVVTEQRRIMMELHDDLGGTLGSLFYTLDGYLLDKETGIPIEPDFELLKTTSGEAIKQLREVMKNNVAKEMSLDSFSLDIIERARSLAAAANLQWKLDRDDQFPQIKLSSYLVHNASLIVKEALQNIRKHSEATSFTICIKVEQGNQQNLVIELADNGRGMNNTTAEIRTDGTGNGLTNMHRRTINLNGELTISSPIGGGTTLRLRIPLTQTKSASEPIQ